MLIKNVYLSKLHFTHTDDSLKNLLLEPDLFKEHATFFCYNLNFLSDYNTVIAICKNLSELHSWHCIFQLYYFNLT